MNIDRPIRSSKYLAGAKDQPCTFRGPTCNCDWATTIPAHLNGAAFGKGMGIRSHDIAMLDACFECHSYIDTGHGRKPLMSDAEFYAALLIGVIRTFVNRTRREIVKVPLDPERSLHDKPTPPRKPKDERAEITQRVDPWPAKGTRKIQSANTLRRKATT